jgi:hypothetical protein
VVGVKAETLHAPHGTELVPLTPAERQIILRKLEHGPTMDREALAEYAKKLRREILEKRKQAVK